MSLRTAGSIAQSALTATQTAITVTSANTANASTDGYTKKTANQTAVTVNGQASGVSVSSVTRDVDQYLLRQVVSSTSANSQASVISSYMSDVDTAYGTVSGSTSIADVIDTVTSDLSTLASGNGTDTDKASTVTALETMASTLSEASSTVQGLRAQADSDIASDVDSANTAITTIASLNKQIVAAKAAGQSTADLEDQRDSQLKTLSSYLGVSYTVDDTGAMQVSTSSGQVLVGSTAHTLSYTAAGSVDASTTYPTGFSALSVDGTDITGSVKSGAIGGLITLRDDTLVDQQTRLDNLASTLITTVNTVSNQGTSYPAATSLTGTATVSASDSLSATGTLRLVAVDSNDDAAAVLNVDLSGVSTVQDLVDTINASGNFTASITSDGHLTIAAADSSDGIAVNEMDSSVGTGKEGASLYFGLNDVLTGTGASDIAVKASLSADSSLLPTGTLSDSSSLAVGDSAITSGDVSTITALEDAFTGTQSFSSAGGLAKATTTLSGYASTIISSAATAASAASTKADTASSTLDDATTALSSQSGVSLDEETAMVSTLEQAYQAAAKIMSTLQEMFTATIEMIN
ncbi:flagellar hook-associated protein FlgK [Nitrospirillum sp. BR 11828]|uniref:flagellar hook-associated protein FlgK n=1 Tax=Nitrospirillum sp. BR 11828 TaxID=3104325 RepID=UPI002AC9F8C0|nr:flagellar hook-associated protein FlgK [Nitrospirillum sp. BR 11828]MDZ5648787.1 flagellar hook-associated protein FlgK [Nitrospirillum sp. BR 11828]